MCFAWYLLVLTRVFSLQWEAIKDSDLTKKRIESIRHVLGHEKGGFSQKFSFEYLLSERAARSVLEKKRALRLYIWLSLSFRLIVLREQPLFIKGIWQKVGGQIFLLL